MFGVDDGAGVTCEGFNQILESDPGKYLKDVLRLESQSGLSSAELKEYVLGKLREYVENSDADKLAELIKNRLSNKFLCRLKVLLPPTAAWNDFFEEKGVRLVLRDTRGLLDMEPQETEAIQRMTTRELGIDGIHAVLVLGSGAAFPDITQKLYRNAYKSVFESAPVFIMNRSDAFRTLYRQRYGRDATAITQENMQAFLKEVRDMQGDFADLDNFTDCYRLLEGFEIGKVRGSGFDYNYKVYENRDLQYVCPNSKTLKLNNRDYCAEDYRLYETAVFTNLKDLLSKVMRHERLREEIDGPIKQGFVNFVCLDEKEVELWPCPRYDYGWIWQKICADILDRNCPVLGPYGGITTQKSMARAAASAWHWMIEMTDEYGYAGSPLNADGPDMLGDIPEECRKNLIRMALCKIIVDHADMALFNGTHYMIERGILKKCIEDIRNLPDGVVESTGMDALSMLSGVAARNIF